MKQSYETFTRLEAFIYCRDKLCKKSNLRADLDSRISELRWILNKTQ